jgi:simple sugar transport system ATP-binding protein
LAEVLEIAERVTVVRDGNLVGVYPTEGMTQARLGELMTGHLIENEVAARDMSANDVVFEANGLSRHGEFADVSFQIRAGEVLGLTGLIGAGRTELAHVMMGMRSADSGTMTLEGMPHDPGTIRQAIQNGMAYVSEDRLSLGLLQKQSIADNTVISVLKKLTAATGLISDRHKADLVRHWIRELGVKIGAPEDAISTLSGGNQQKVVLAKWLATEPKLLILDSPTVGVDVGARAGIFRIVQSLAEEGLAILLISDEVTEVMYHSDRILHMADGRIVSEIDPHTITVPEFEERIYA